MLVPDVVRSVSADLNDQEPKNEFIHWPYDQLRNYLFEAMQQIAPYAHKLFTHRKLVQVEPGATWQKACCDCDQILRIIGETDKAGNLIHTLRRIEDNPDNVWPTDIDSMCPITEDNYEMEGYSISNTDDTYFQVVPAVPVGATRYVMLECFTGVHCITDNYDVHWRFVPMVKMWMLGRAYMMDSENNSAVFQMGAQYMERFDKMLARFVAEQEAEEREKCFGSQCSMGTVSKQQA